MFKHPTKDELSGFILGKLPLDVSDAVADHLEQCSPCQETIHDLEAHQDTLLHDLRQAPPQSLEIDAECVQAIERVSAALSAVAPALSSSASPLSESIASSADVLSREQFLANLRTSGILDEEHWATLNKLPILAQAVDGAALAGALVECGALTKFQATLICQDKPNGLLFGEYVVLDLLGIGGMGQVFKARHRSMDRIVALKVLAKAAVKSPDAIKRFQREVKAAAKLIHPNIVTAFDAGQQDGVHFLVMEYVPGSDLSALVKRNGPLPVDKVISYIIQVARGLAFAHAKGIVHRDIKPGNLLVDHEGTVRILDMGLARLDGDAASKTAGEELTQTGQVMGTVDYMAPEQAFDTGTADAKADTYSLGCTLYRLLTGQSLFSGDTLIQKILAHREQPIPSLTAACPKVPPQLDAIYQRMVAKQPADRPTMAELIVELETFAKGEPTTTFIVSKRTAELDSKPPATTQAVQQSEERTSHGAGKKPPARKLLAAGAAGFLLLCLGIWVIVRDEDGNEVGRMKVPAGGSTVVTEIRQPSTEAGHKLAGEPNAKSSASPVTVPDPQNSRAFAEFIISHGGKVTPTGFKGADGRPLEIGLVSELPPGDWTIEGISLRTNPLATDDFMSRLAQVPNVQRLYLHDAQLTAVGVRHLCTILTLEELWLTHVPVGDEIMKDVVRLPALKRLVIALTNITDASLGGLKQMPKLTSVDVSGTSVSDEGLRELSNLKQLTYLNFRGTSISDTGLGHLTNLRSLKTLILEKTKVTSAGVQLIRRAIPNCEIELGQSSTEVTSAQQVAAAPLSSSGTPSTGGYTLEFDGNTHVMVDSMTGAIKTPLCLEVWVRPQLPPTAKNTGKVFDFAIPAQTDYFAISVARPEATTDRGYWRVNGKWVETPMQSPLGSVAWGERTHLAASFAENVLRVFLNGKLIQEQPLKNVSLMAPEAHLRLGVGFIGTMEAMRVSQTLRYDGDFTPPQRLEADAGTQILYRFDEGSGAVIRNVIGGGHHGKIIRPKWVSTGTTQPALAGNQKVSLSSPINLLPTLQPATHLFGKWEWVNGAMQATITDKSHYDHLAFDYPAPEEYDLRLVAERLEQGEKDVGILLGLVSGSSKFRVGIDHGSKRNCTLATIDNAKLPLQSTKIGPQLQLGKKHEVIVKVRHTGVDVFLDGERQLSYAGTLHRLSRDPAIDAKFPRFYLTSYVDARFHELELTPVAPPVQAPAPAIAPFDAKQARAHQEAWAKHLGLPVEYENSIGMKFMLIPPGEFLMGSTDEQVADAMALAVQEGMSESDQSRIRGAERPPHPVRLTRPWYLGVREVTSGEFRKFVEAEHYITETEKLGGGGTSTSGLGGDPKIMWRTPGKEFGVTDPADAPVIQITWNDAVAFCDWLTKQEAATSAADKLPGAKFRLPTEAEWEFACRAGTTTQFSFGDDPAQLVRFDWAKSNSSDMVSSKSRKPANPFGVTHMHGNVMEWCGDRFGSTYYQSSPIDDPLGPDTGPNRVIRGGYWAATASKCRSAYRFNHPDTARSNTLGFRVVQVLDVPDLKSTTSVMPTPAGAILTQTPFTKSIGHTPPPAIAPFDAKQARAHQEAWAKHLGLPVEYENSIGMKFMLIPPGEFLMGSTDEELAALIAGADPRFVTSIDGQRIKQESPQRRVTITRPFWMCTTETTRSQFAAVPEVRAVQPPVTSDVSAMPVIDVSWQAADEFCKRLTLQEKKPVGEQDSPFAGEYRLPSEAEWEFACRAGTTTAYSFGDDAAQLARYAVFDGKEQPVAGKLPNPFGMYDMHGNAGEWCRDYFGPYDDAPATDPRGPSNGALHALRGGRPNGGPERCRSAHRGCEVRKLATVNRSVVGFRVVREIP